MDTKFNAMEHRHSSPSSRPDSPRPSTHRKRSNSVPIMEALGCSTPEARLILAEGRAAVHRRQASGGRGRKRENNDGYRPKDHLRYLDADVPRRAREDSMSIEDRKSFRHSRFPSDVTDSSINTVIAPTTPLPTKNTIGTYSANLAKFIQARLSSIPSYNTTQLPVSPCSCPDLSYTSRTPQLSPAMSTRRPVDAPRLIQIPPIRPPMQSAFSEWSSTDDDTDDERPAVLTSETSVLHYYENSDDSTFLFTPTPLEEDDDPDIAKGLMFSNQSSLPESTTSTPSPSLDSNDYSSVSTHPQLTCSSAPSFSSVSTREYFDFKLNPQMRARIIAAVTPPPHKIIPAISPFDGAALSNVHDVLVQSHHRVLVDGMSFDMLRDLNMPAEGGLRRMQTPC